MVKKILEQVTPEMHCITTRDIHGYYDASLHRGIATPITYCFYHFPFDG